jgi:hypothetical protein
MIKDMLKAARAKLASWLVTVPVGRQFCEAMAVAATNHKQTIGHAARSMTFAAPNGLNRYRIAALASKEPGTVERIEAIPSGSVL